IVVAAFFIEVLTWGMQNTFGVFFIPLSNEFGWTRAMVSGAPSLLYFMVGLAGIFAGRLNDRFGPRLVMTLCGLFLGFGYLLMSQVNAIWQFYLFYGIIIALGMSGPDVSLLSTIAKWFVKKRGMMSGIIKAGAGVGMLVTPLAVNWLISTYEWRASYIIIGLIALVFTILAAQFLKSNPSRMELLLDGDVVEVKKPQLPTSGLSLREAIQARQFWLLGAVFFLFIFCTQTVMVHIYPHTIDLGVSSSVAANVLATIGGASIAGRFLMGSASDRIGTKLATIIDLIILVTSLLWLQVASEAWMLYAFATLYGFAHGGLFALVSPLIAELFGLRSHGVIFGIIMFGGTTGGAIGPVLAGYIFDITSSYQLDFIVITSASIIATLLTAMIKRKD
ncbi:MFS transporter, partial [Chloroflexota bacterium]